MRSVPERRPFISSFFRHEFPTFITPCSTTTTPSCLPHRNLLYTTTMFFASAPKYLKKRILSPSCARSITRSVASRRCRRTTTAFTDGALLVTRSSMSIPVWMRNCGLLGTKMRRNCENSGVGGSGRRWRQRRNARWPNSKRFSSTEQYRSRTTWISLMNAGQDCAEGWVVHLRRGRVMSVQRGDQQQQMRSKQPQKKPHQLRTGVDC